MKNKPRPKTKLPKLVEIVDYMYLDLLFVTCLVKHDKSIKKKCFTWLLFPRIK